jgi:hypothetical protein
MPTKNEESIMAVWLRENHIAFEVTRLDIDKSIELKLIDYKHNCLLVSKQYHELNIHMGHAELERLVKKFEREEIYSILFEDIKIRDAGIAMPTTRLIRED